MRCSKLQLQCVVDKSHKRVSRRSKLEELQQEVRSIKEAVGKSNVPSPVFTRTLPPINSRDGLLSHTLPPMRPFDAPVMLPPVLTPSVTTTPTPKTVLSSLGGRTAEPRALKSRAFSGEDISHYFDKYFEYFHPHFPIIRTRDPDKIYESAPLLFWTIMVIAARRFAKDDSVLPFLTESLPSEVWGAMGNPPLPLGMINALLLLCAWPFTTIRFLRDPSTIFSSIAMSSCFMIGLHTGRGEHPELANPNFQIRNTDEEATFTWAGFNIISQRVSSYTGSPSTGQFFNKTIENILDRSSPVPVPINFIILLECARFSNRLSKTTCASLEENRGISHHIVDMFEEEFDKVQRLLFPGISEVDYFTLLSTLQDVQAFYFMPVAGFSSEIFKRNVLKAYSTSQLVLRQALKLQDEVGFLYYAPHFVCRTLLASACITLNVLLSPYIQDMPVHAKDALMHDAIVAIKTCSVHDGDLPSRASKMIESYWSVHHTKAPMEIPMKDVSQFSSRLGTSFAFDYIRRWKRDIEASRSSATNVNGKRQATGIPAASIDLSTIQPENAQLIDWDAFMDDFDWSFTPDYFNPA
ncbi:c6 zinc finger domain containing protein [Sporothrix schenckii 1099-18]|nr:c6 zinc finger domain containing protein [Sporothrix schenckii 1099-18]KJR82959.1 c6 zinc finger domain containing protein [Sporothrix schenckii 1099-18]